MMTLPLQPDIVTTDEAEAVRSSLDAAMDAGLPDPVTVSVERGADGNIVLVQRMPLSFKSRKTRSRKSPTFL